MDSNPQLLRRTHSPFVAAAAAAAAPSTVAIETHDQLHPHLHHHHHQSPLAGQGLRQNALSPSQPSSHLGAGGSLLQINKPLSGGHGVSSSASTSSSAFGSSSATSALKTTVGSGTIPFSATGAHGHNGLFDQSQQPLTQPHQHQHQHHHNHNHGHSPRIGQANGSSGSVSGHNHEHHDHHHHHHEPQQSQQPPVFQQQPPQQHNHHNHDHHGHGHDHHGHDHHDHSHDHHNHDHHDHAHEHNHHAHGHDHHAHGHDHHGHGHDHHGHGHDHHGHDHHGHDHAHHHHHPVSFRSQLPSYSQIFGDLKPKQKTMFTWILIHSTIAVMTWLSGMKAGSLSIIGLSYMMLFDAFGVLNIFVSSVIHTDVKMKRSTVKHPFGVQRFEIVFGLFNAIFLLFIGMNMLKESLEHLMLEDDHHGSSEHAPNVGVPLFWTVIALGATLVSSLGYQNHKQYCLLLNSNSMTSTQAAFARSGASPVAALAGNPFALTSLGCVVGVMFVSFFPHFDSLDKLVAIGQSIVMFALGGPLTKTLGMILLQTTPPRALEGVEEAIRQLSGTHPGIVKMERAHVWTNTYGQMIGTLVVSVTKGADEQAIMASVHQRLQGFLDLDAKSEGTGELTVQLVQSH